MKQFSNHICSGTTWIPTINIPKEAGGDAWGILSGSNTYYGSSDASLFSSSLPVLPHEKFNLNESERGFQSVEYGPSDLEKLQQDVEGIDSLEDLQTHAIGSLLPDDEEELLAGIMEDFDLNGLPGSLEDLELEEYDIFDSGGGMELETDPQESLSMGMSKLLSDGVVGNGMPHYAIPNGVGTVAGEHPYGEHPSRTLFVRNINSNVEDSELSALFEQYGDIRTLYTACKHRGFVMISYYDIRAARTAMRALQNKPLRRRKLDIHFSIPKDNPSDKDINQGTLVVFNLDPSVSNEDLRQIFGAYGEVKEIRETPHKRHHKFIEFYDVRAAEAALKSLNRSDIAGKRIKLEPSRPGGARRNLMLQLNQELEQDESRSFRPPVGSPIANSPPGNWGQFNGSMEHNSMQTASKSPVYRNLSPTTGNHLPGLASILHPQLSTSLKVAPIGKDQGRSSHVDSDRTLTSHSSSHLLSIAVPPSVTTQRDGQREREKEKEGELCVGALVGMAKEEEFRVYNSLTQQKEIFKPHEPGRVGMYVCGVTAYDLSHLGHARAAVNFDVLFRYLQHLGYQVTYVRNFTDVDDKIIRRANELGEDPLSLSNRFCQEYVVDMADLLCLPPTHEPRVSDHMEQIKDMITQIINNDCAYTVEGDVFFAVDKSLNYGQLSGQKLENNRAGERVAVDSRKRNPADFALWKAAKPGEPSWDSPWGPGRPGWHIECSAMSAQYLSFQFDIHGGGIDLIFPHHENEIAQSCAACQESCVSYWMHNGHVTNNNEKMSKSLGNFFTIREITRLYHPLALRHFLISAHYRSPLNYTVLQLESASDAVYYIYQTLEDCRDALSPSQEGSLKEGSEQKVKTVRVSPVAQECIGKLRSEFKTKMSDDLNTAQILTGAFQEALKFINSSLTMLKKKQQKQQQLSMIQSLIEVEKEVKEVLNILGLLSSSTYVEVLQQLKDKALKRAGLEENDVLHLIEERALARKNKDFSKSDQIRADLTVKGIALMDVGKETIWRPCVPVELEQPAPPVEQEHKALPV